jgi:hypothetical protein
MNIEDLKNIMIEHPTLGADGMNTKEIPNVLLKYLDACNASCEWLSLVTRTKKPNRNTHTSYGFKHVVESWYNKKYNTRRSVPNGAFIAAALHLGFLIQPKETGSLYVYLNISSRTKIDYEHVF